LGAVTLALFLVIRGGGGGSSADAEVQVATTMPLLADFVREVGGDRVEVFSVIPNGAEPHRYEPTDADLSRVPEADVAFANGRGLEPPAVTALEANLRPGVALVRIVDDEEALEAAGAELLHAATGHERDPHIWMGIFNGKAYAGIIQDTLIELDPAGESEYNENFRSFVEEIDETERYVFERLDAVPPENKHLITTHDGFAYFGSYYAVELTAVLIATPGQEPTADDLARITGRIRETEAVAVFTEPQLSAENEFLAQAAEETGAQVCTLYSDILDYRVKSYIDLIRFDGDELYRCLGGEG
jgi:ABC-type Zn uptake system ZnuABC Zn-binding protein ZnuA